MVHGPVRRGANFALSLHLNVFLRNQISSPTEYSWRFIDVSLYDLSIRER